MTILEKYNEYLTWVSTTPSRFIIDNDNIVYKSEDVGVKILEILAAKSSVSTSVRVEDNKADLAGFLAWGEQICKC